MIEGLYKPGDPDTVTLNVWSDELTVYAPEDDYVVYYAHTLSLYDTAQEARDILTLQDLGFTVISPNTEPIQRVVAKAKSRGHDVMLIFEAIIQRCCDALAFRALPDGAISAGVAREIDAAAAQDLPIIELPNGLMRRALTVEQTREYLKDTGQR